MNAPGRACTTLGVAAAVVVAAAVSLDTLTPTARAESSFSAVALVGAQAPGFQTGVTFTSFEEVQLGDDGRVLFLANVIGPGVTNNVNDEALWIGPPGSLVLTVRRGTQAPTFAPGVTFEFLATPVIARNRGASFFARLDGPGISDDAVEPGNDDTLWAIAGTALPPYSRGSGVDAIPVMETARSQLADNRTPCILPYQLSNGEYGYVPLNSSDTTAATTADVVPQGSSCSAALGNSTAGHGPTAAADGALQRALIVASATERSIVVATDETAPGTSENLLSIHAARSTRGDGGVIRVVVRGGLASGSGVWAGPRDALLPVALPGAAVPASLESELGTGATFGNLALGDVGINAAGAIAFVAAIAAPSESALLTLVAGAPDDLHVVARERASQAAQGFLGFSGPLVLNAAGDVAFLASDTSLGGFPGELRALWTRHEQGEAVSPLAEGRTAPGLEAGEVLTFFEDGPYMNASGQVLVRAGIGAAGGAANTQTQAFWLVDPVGGSELVVREGQTIELDGEARGVSSVGLVTAFASTRSGGEDGRPDILNNDGDFIFFAVLEREGGGFQDAVIVASRAPGGSCGDATGDADVSASDALAVLLTAVGLDDCVLCICDVDQSGAVAATDALATLQAAVGIPGITLDCPSC